MRNATTKREFITQVLCAMAVTALVPSLYRSNSQGDAVEILGGMLDCAFEGASIELPECVDGTHDMSFEIANEYIHSVESENGLEIVKKKIAMEGRSGDIVSLGGWMVTRTECEIAHVVSLMRRHPHAVAAACS